MRSISFANNQEKYNPQEGHVVVGRIGGPWGLRGDLKVEVLTDFPRRFSPGSVLYLDGRSVRVERSHHTGRRTQIKLDVVNSRNEAHLLRGQFLTVPVSDVVPLPEGSYYHFQIIGMEVWDEDGGLLGKVTQVLPTGSNDVYLVENECRKELLIPALQGVILRVNPEESMMSVRLPEGLG